MLNMFDIKSIPEYLKNILVNVWLLPFWYLAIYIFSPKLYAKDDFILIASLCICLTVLSTMTTALLSMICNSDTEDVPMFEITNTIYYFVVQLGAISILIFISYVWYIITGDLFRLYGFVLIYFTSLFMYFLITTLIEKVNDKKNNKK